MNISVIQCAASAICILLGLFFELLAVVGANRFDRALNRMHAAAIGDTLGILFVILGLIVKKGLCMDSMKLLLIIAFFWVASPVCSHMLARLEAMTDGSLGKLDVIHEEEEHEDI